MTDLDDKILTQALTVKLSTYGLGNPVTDMQIYKQNTQAEYPQNHKLVTWAITAFKV